MRNVAKLTLLTGLLGLAGASLSNAAPVGNIVALPDRVVTGTESPLLNKVGRRHGHRGYGWRRWHGGGFYPYGYYGGYYPYRYSYGAYPFFYGGPSIYFGFGGDRHHRHWRRWH